MARLSERTSSTCSSQTVANMLFSSVLPGPARPARPPPGDHPPATGVPQGPRGHQSRLHHQSSPRGCRPSLPTRQLCTASQSMGCSQSLVGRDLTGGSRLSLGGGPSLGTHITRRDSARSDVSTESVEGEPSGRRECCPVSSWRLVTPATCEELDRSCDVLASADSRSD